jgi:hypothetical protein
MPFKSGKLKGKLTRKELIDLYGDDIKIGKTWSRDKILDKLISNGINLETEKNDLKIDSIEKNNKIKFEKVEPEIIEPKVVETTKKKRGRPKKTSN